MKVTELSVTKKYNLGNYQMLEIKASVIPTPEEAEMAIPKLITELHNEVEKAKKEIEKDGV